MSAINLIVTFLLFFFYLSCFLWYEKSGWYDCAYFMVGKRWCFLYKLGAPCCAEEVSFPVRLVLLLVSAGKPLGDLSGMSFVAVFVSLIVGIAWIR